MWFLVLILSACTNHDPDCRPAYIVAAQYTTQQECESHLIAGNPALLCVPQ